ncbi:MAG: adenylyltransferase/cytidyltransferase family protein [Solirubrobacterales bacterium]
MSTEDLGRHGPGTAMVSGGFDPLHPGHILYFREAAGLGLPILCNITGDHYVSRKHPPLLPADQRVQVVDAIRYVDVVHVSELTTVEVLERARPEVFVKGEDWRGRLPQEEVEVCERAGIEVVYLDTVISSSSGILADYDERLRRARS